jgi:ADP-ribosyl-[dinitrogen reductase] hydrolase
MLFEMAIGDAYGAAFEYVPPAFVSSNNTLSGYLQHPDPKHTVVPAKYTDDTQMSIANAEVILAGGPLTASALAGAYVRCFKRDRRDGYARGFQAFLSSVSDGSEFLARIKADSDKSGAAMRALPFGIYPNITTVKANAALQASITHNTADGVNAAVAAALMAHYFLYNVGAKAQLGAFIQSHVPGTWAQPYTGAVGQKGLMSVHAAVTAVMACNSMSDLLRMCVDFTGDVDTVAALALGAAAASPEIKQDLPSVLVNGLETGPYGQQFLRICDAQLRQLMFSLRTRQSIAAPPAAAISPTASPPRMMAVLMPGHIFEADTVQAYLEIPAGMDIAQEEKAWFAAGGDASGKNFATYLIAQGAKQLSVETWRIGYPY